MQQRLGVATRLAQALEHQIAGSHVGHAGVKVPGHRLVQRVTGVLLVHHRRHALKGFLDLRRARDPVVQPVRHVLAADAQRGAVFHQRDVVDVGHLGAAHTLVDPAHHITQNALGVVVHRLRFFDVWLAVVTGKRRTVKGLVSDLIPILITTFEDYIWEFDPKTIQTKQQGGKLGKSRRTVVRRVHATVST